MKTNTMMLVLASALGLGAKAAVDLSAIQFFAMGDTVVENDLNGQTIASATLPKGTKMVLTNGSVTTLAANGADVEISTGATVGTATGATDDDTAANVIIASDATNVGTLTLTGADTTGVVANTKKPATINAVVGDVGETETTYYTDWNKVVGEGSVVASGKTLEIQKSYTAGQAKLASVNDTVTIDASAQAYAASDVTTIENAKVIAQGETVNNTTTYIAKWDMEKATIASVGDQTYKGSAYNELTPEVTHPGVQGALASGTDFDFSYGENTTVAQDGTITATGKGNFTGTKSIAFDIVGKQLTVAANDKPLTYGDAPANAGVTYDGFVTGEDESLLGGALDYDYAYAQYDDVGTYDITPKGLTADNYEIVFVKGSQVVSRRPVTLAWGETTSWTFDNTAHLPTADVNNVVNNDDVTASVTEAQTHVGNYTASAVLAGAKIGNYELTGTTTQAFGITPRPIAITVTGTDATRTYNGLDQSQGAAYTLASDDTLGLYADSKVVREATSVSGKDVGTYEYSLAANQFSYNDSDYTATFTVASDGRLTINPLVAQLAWSNYEGLIYSGDEQCPVATVANLCEQDTCAVTVTGGQTVPGSGYTATATALANSNYALPAETTQAFAISGTVPGARTIKLDDGVTVAIADGTTVTVADGTKNASMASGTVVVSTAANSLNAEVVNGAAIASTGEITLSGGQVSYLYGNQADVDAIAAAAQSEQLTLTGDTLKIKATN